ncbi:MAG: gliding motility-associated C-terminal domain-containing protein [Bacteroidales bacterium]
MMKHLLPVLFFFCSFVAKSQVSVEVKPNDTICFRDSVTFIATPAGAAKYTYQWQLDLADISGATDSIYAIKQATGSSLGSYRCIVSGGVKPDTTSALLITMHPRMYIDTIFRYNQLGCFGDCKGQFKALVSGGTQMKNDPYYIYNWNAGHSQDTIVFGLCPRSAPYTFRATDSLGCSIDTSYFVDFLKSPKVTFKILPDSVIYKTNPTIQVVFPDSMTKYITNWTWDFGDSLKMANRNPAFHTYADTCQPKLYYVRLKFTDLNGCDTTITNQLTIKKPELDIPNVFTPNADYVNDKFVIRLMDDYGKEKDFNIAYLGNELLIYDRWGKKIFGQVNYKSEDWDGDRLSDGTYFYILKLTEQYRDTVLRGSVTILRGK